MYESFFGLDGLPFKITPDDRVFYGGAQRQDMLDALIYTLERGEGLVTVIGEVGTGKTTLARVLSKRLPENIKLASIYMPNVQPLDMLYMIAQELGLDIPPNEPKYIVVEKLRDYLQRQQESGHRTLLLVDEAQTMPLETLEELRLLSNMQMDDFKLLQIMLFGQQELDQVLNLPSVRQVKDRIVYHLDLKPFSLEELSDYLAFRMKMVGYRGEQFFSPEVVAAIYKETKGFPRAVNKLADHVLMAAFAQQSEKITLAHVGMPIHATTIHFREHPSLSSRVKNVVQELTQNLTLTPIQISAAAVLSVVVVIVLLVFAFSDRDDSTQEAMLTESTSASQEEPLKIAEVSSNESQSVSTVVDTNVETKAVVEARVVPAPAVVPVHLSQREQREQEVASKTVIEAPAKKTIVKQETMPAPAQTAVVAPKSEAVHSIVDWSKNRDLTIKSLAKFAKEERYSIRLMSSPWRIRDEFHGVSRLILLKLPDNPSFITDYVLADGRARVALLYGVYNTQSEAQDILRELPAFAKAYNPVIVSFKQALDQMRQSNVLQMEP